MKKNKKFNSNKLVNKEMDEKTFILRKKAMSFIYEAKKLVPSLPRIELRITHDHEVTLAMGRMNKNIIWVSDRAINQKEFDLRTIVFHEILHAAFGVEHDESCPLMKSIHAPLSKNEAERLFLFWVTKMSVKKASRTKDSLCA